MAAVCHTLCHRGSLGNPVDPAEHLCSPAVGCCMVGRLAAAAAAWDVVDNATVFLKYPSCEEVAGLWGHAVVETPVHQVLCPWCQSGLVVVYVEALDSDHHAVRYTDLYCYSLCSFFDLWAVYLRRVAVVACSYRCLGGRPAVEFHRGRKDTVAACEAGTVDVAHLRHHKEVFDCRPYVDHIHQRWEVCPCFDYFSCT